MLLTPLTIHFFFHFFQFERPYDYYYKFLYTFINCRIRRYLSFIQSTWASYDANQLTRETFMAALAKVDAILIRATYHTQMAYATLRGLSLDTAVPQNTGQAAATWLEDCTCPPQYTGLSCQVGSKAAATWLEDCTCPPQYTGLSCQVGS